MLDVVSRSLLSVTIQFLSVVINSSYAHHSGWSFCQGQRESRRRYRELDALHGSQVEQLSDVQFWKIADPDATLTDFFRRKGRHMLAFRSRVLDYFHQGVSSEFSEVAIK